MIKQESFFLDDVENARYDVFLKKLQLTNFRCFNRLDISFEEQLTVIISENGGGKTAILDAIAGCLKNLLAEFYVEDYQIKNASNKDIKIGTETGECKLFANVEYLFNDILIEEEEDIEGNLIEKEVSIEKVNIENNLEILYTYGDYLSPFKKEVENNLIPFSNYENRNGKKISFPIMAYFGGETVKVQKHETLENTNALNIIYENALDGNRLHYSHFYNWWLSNYYQKLEIVDSFIDFNESISVVAHRVNEGKYEKDSTFIKVRDDLKKISSAIEYLLNDNLTKPTYKNLRIKKNHGSLEMGMDKITYNENGEIESDFFVEINQLSAGEKALFAYVGDLGLRLLHANPIETSAEDTELYVFKGRGVVLIDEIDLHLHIKWQQKVIEKLLKIFPGVQFVITTHSLIALGKLRSQNVRLISDSELYSIPDTYGQDIAIIIEKIWQIPSSFIKGKIKEVYRLLTKNDLQEIELAKTKLYEIQEEVKGEIPAIKEAWVILEHKEKHLKK
jgi:predicted ATP-binding protein involved in virulence